MWKDNKYTKWYFSIIENAKTRVYSKEEYVENHHIIPKSLGGLRTKENMVTLSAREHFICHMLLIRMSWDKNSKAKMVHAAWFFQGNFKHSGFRINCNTYEYLKIQKRRANSSRKQSPEEIEKRAAANRGKKRSEEQKLRMSEAQQEYLRTSFNADVASMRTKIGMANMSHEAKEEMKRKQSLTKIGKPMLEETKRKAIEWHTGRTRSEEWKRNISLGHLNRNEPKPLKMKNEIEWELEYEDGSKIKISDIRTFALEKRVHERKLRRSFSNNKFVDGYRIIDKQIKQVLKSTTKQRKTDLFALGLI